MMTLAINILITEQVIKDVQHGTALCCISGNIFLGPNMTAGWLHELSL